MAPENRVMSEGCAAAEFGDFTGCLFQVTGENIARAAFSVDWGGLLTVTSSDGAKKIQDYRFHTGSLKAE